MKKMINKKNLDAHEDYYIHIPKKTIKIIFRAFIVLPFFILTSISLIRVNNAFFGPEIGFWSIIHYLGISAYIAVFGYYVVCFIFWKHL